MQDRTYTADATPGETVTVAGWVHEIRDLGGIAFLILRDGTGKIQIKFEKDEMDEDLVETGLDVHRESVISVSGDVEEEPRAGRRVTAPRLEGLPQRVPREVRRGETHEPPADVVFRQVVGMGDAGAAGVVVGPADEADLVAPLQGLAAEPLEDAPDGVYLDERRQIRVVRVQRRGTAPLMGDDEDVVATAVGLVQLLGGVGPRGLRLALGGQPVRRAADLGLVAPEIDVVVAAERRVRRPLVTEERDELARVVEVPDRLLDLRPELVGDLEVVAGVRGEVEERTVTRVIEVLLDGPGPDRLAGLPVQVAPVGPEASAIRGFESRDCAAPRERTRGSDGTRGVTFVPRAECGGMNELGGWSPDRIVRRSTEVLVA